MSKINFTPEEQDINERIMLIIAKALVEIQALLQEPLAKGIKALEAKIERRESTLLITRDASDS